MNIFKHLEYTEALAEMFELAKNRPGKWTIAQMAQDLNIQPSYVTNVIKGRAEFSTDQLYAVCDYLGADLKSTEFLILLLEHKRSAIPKRKTELKKQIEKIQNEHRKSEAHIKAERLPENAPELTSYYMDPFCQLVHVFMNFPEYAKNPQKLCGKIAISEKHMHEILTKRENLHYIEAGKNGYEVKLKNRHLPKESPLCQPHQSLLRYKSIDQMQRVSEKDRYSFSVTFSSSPEDKNRIQSEFLEFLKKAEVIVKNTKREHVYQINFDLFPWELE
jgi:uncharacterized protein (TIGR02147 family)